MRWVRRVLDQYLSLGIGSLGLATIVGLLLAQKGDISKVLGELQGIRERLDAHETWIKRHGQKIDDLDARRGVPCPLHPGIVEAVNRTDLKREETEMRLRDHLEHYPRMEIADR